MLTGRAGLQCRHRLQHQSHEYRVIVRTVQLARAALYPLLLKAKLLIERDGRTVRGEYLQLDTLEPRGAAPLEDQGDKTLAYSSAPVTGGHSHAERADMRETFEGPRENVAPTDDGITVKRQYLDGS